MVWKSKVGKLWARDHVLAGLVVRGDETVLEVGRGRDLILGNQTARRRRPSGTGVFTTNLDLSR